MSEFHNSSIFWSRSIVLLIDAKAIRESLKSEYSDAERDGGEIEVKIMIEIKLCDMSKTYFDDEVKVKFFKKRGMYFKMQIKDFAVVLLFEGLFFIYFINKSLRIAECPFSVEILPIYIPVLSD